MKWLRRLACRLFKLVPREEYEAASVWRIKAWDDALTSKRVDPIWPLIASTETWTRHLLPAYRQMLADTMLLLINEPDEKLKYELQIQAQFINRLIRQPEFAMQRDEMLRERLYNSGQLDADDRIASGRAAGVGNMGTLGGQNGR